MIGQQFIPYMGLSAHPLILHSRRPYQSVFTPTRTPYQAVSDWLRYPLQSVLVRELSGSPVIASGGLEIRLVLYRGTYYIEGGEDQILNAQARGQSSVRARVALRQ